MINIFISLLFLLMSFGMFSFSFSVHGINRLVINVPRTIFEYSVVVEESDEPYYHEEVVNKYKSYIDKSIKQYANDYTIGFRFYDPETGGICIEKCQGVEVSLDCKLAFSYNYHRVMFYEISEVNHG